MRAAAKRPALRRSLARGSARRRRSGASLEGDWAERRRAWFTRAGSTARSCASSRCCSSALHVSQNENTCDCSAAAYAARSWSTSPIAPGHGRAAGTPTTNEDLGTSVVARQLPRARLSAGRRARGGELPRRAKLPGEWQPRRARELTTTRCASFHCCPARQTRSWRSGSRTCWSAAATRCATARCAHARLCVSARTRVRVRVRGVCG